MSAKNRQVCAFKGNCHSFRPVRVLVSKWILMAFLIARPGNRPPLLHGLSVTYLEKSYKSIFCPEFPGQNENTIFFPSSDQAEP